LNYQNQSWYGNNQEKDNPDIINHLFRKNLIDEVHYFQIYDFAKTPQEAKILERQKRQEGQRILKNKGLSHNLEMDVDEFYKEDEFYKAKQMLIDMKVDFSACHFINYYKDPRFQEIQESKSLVPFICKLDNQHTIGEGTFLGNMDPTRGYKLELSDSSHLFNSNTLIMHHMTSVRTSLEDKYNNTSMINFDREKIKKIVDKVQSINEYNLCIESEFGIIAKNYRVVDNCFNIKI
jgi:hypothetical protein